MAKLEEKILQDAAYRPIVFHDQDPHTVVSAAREIPAVVDAQGRTNRHDFQVLSISSVALPGWKSGQFLSDGQKVGDRKSTRLNSSHLVISYAVFCLKKKNKQMCIL